MSDEFRVAPAEVAEAVRPPVVPFPPAPAGRDSRASVDLPAVAEAADAPAPGPDAVTPDIEQAGRKKKKKDKVRAAWISFVGRILAQFVGAAATIVLGLFLVHKYQDPPAGTGESGNGSAAGARRVAQAPVPGKTSIAVLPLENLSPDPRQEYFADGMTDALIADLARVEGLRVISRTSSMHYKGQRKPLPEIAQELGVEVIVEGTVTLAEGRVRITAQLIDATTDEHLWAQNYERPLRDILSLQAAVAAAIAKEVNVALAPRRQLSARKAVDPVAFDLHLNGRHARGQRTTPAGFRNAIH